MYGWDSEQDLNHNCVLFPGVTFLKDQFHAVGILEDVSVKVTANGAVPLLTLDMKSGYRMERWCNNCNKVVNSLCIRPGSIRRVQSNRECTNVGIGMYRILHCATHSVAE